MIAKASLPRLAVVCRHQSTRVAGLLSALRMSDVAVDVFTNPRARALRLSPNLPLLMIDTPLPRALRGRTQTVAIKSATLPSDTDPLAMARQAESLFAALGYHATVAIPTARSGGCSNTAAVAVTYSRFETLMTMLASIDQQTMKPGRIIVVDNSSPDDTATQLALARPDIQVVLMPQNLGPGAALATGMRVAFSTGADVCWLLEDDTLYDSNYLAHGLEILATRPELGMLGSRGFHLALGAWAGIEVTHDDPVFAYPLLDGALITSAAVGSGGYPAEDYFIMVQDVEYPLRLSDHSISTAVSRRLLAEPLALGSSSGPAGDFRSYYQTRNHLRLVLARRSPMMLLWFIRRTIAQLARESLHQRTRPRVCLRLRGILDGLRGRMGRTIDPSGRPAGRR